MYSTAESEYLVQDALDHLVKGRTVITIAHRLSTIRKADEIIMIENGVVIESGTFNDLIAQGGSFKRLVDRQTDQGYDESDDEENEPQATS